MSHNTAQRLTGKDQSNGEKVVRWAGFIKPNINASFASRNIDA